MRLINKEKLESEMYHNAFEIDTDLQKWDSGCWIRYKMFENVIEEQPEVKAIPIELIEKEMKRLDEDIKWAWYYGNTALDKMEYLKTWLTIKLEDWEQENEVN